MLINKCRYHKLAYISNHLHTCTRIATLHIGCCISYPSENGRCYISQEAKKKRICEYIVFHGYTSHQVSLCVCYASLSLSLFIFSDSHPTCPFSFGSVRIHLLDADSNDFSTQLAELFDSVRERKDLARAHKAIVMLG